MENYENNDEEIKIEVEEIIEEDEPIITKIIDVDNLEEKFDKEEIDNNIKYSTLSYIGILFLLPIVVGKYKKSKYLQFHVNQGLNLFALELFVIIVIGLLNNIFTSINNHNSIWLSIINFIMYSVVVILMLYGIINTMNGKSKKLPIIGKYHFIK